MKKLRFILITLLFQSAFGQDLSIHAGLFTTSQKAVYESKISKELVYKYSLKQGIYKDSVFVKEIIYDTLGNKLIETLLKNTNNSPVKYEYYYNVQGKRIKEKAFFMSPNNFYKEYEYDSAGNEILVYDYNADTSQLSVTTKKYNKKNQLIQVNVKLNNNQEFINIVYKYDSVNQLVEEVHYNLNSDFSFFYNYEYSNENKELKIIYGDADTTDTRRVLYFDDKKRCIKEVVYFDAFNDLENEESDLINQQRTLEFIYNNNNTLKEVRVFVKDKLKFLYKHFYFP